MKKVTILGLAFLFLISSANLCLAAKDGQKGASDKAYENANENAIFNRVDDWFSTVGKSEEEKEKILAEKKAKRAAKRAEKQAKKEAKKAEKELKKQRKDTEDKVEDTKKNFDKKMKKGSSKQKGSKKKGS